MTWHDDGVKLLVDVSDSGTFIAPPFRVDYPFTGGAMPDGWSYYLPTGTVSTDVTVSNSNGIVKLGRGVGNDTPTTDVGIQRGISITPGHRYRVSCQVQGIALKNATTMVTLYASFYSASGFEFSRSSRPWDNGMPDATNWYTMSVDQVATAPNGTPCTSVQIQLTIRLPLGVPNTSDFGASWSTVALTDTTVATAPTFTWHEIVCDTLDANIRFGRARFTERYDVGTFQVRLNNVSGEYMYNENHPWGFRPGRMFRLRAQKNSITYPMCLGVIDRVKTDMQPDGKANVTLTAFDTTSYTSDIPTPQISFSSTGVLNDIDSLSGNRVTALLNYAGVALAMRQIDPGIFGTQNIEESGRGLREEIGVTADSEGGAFFGERDGKLVYRDRSWSTRDPKGGTVQANFTAFRAGYSFNLQPDDIPTDPNAPVICPSEMDTDWSLERVINQITLAVSGSTRYFFTNIPSQTENGIRTYQRLDFVNRGGSSSSFLGGTLKEQLQMRATDIFSTSLDALLRVQRLTYRPHGSDWIFTLTVFLNWLVRVLYYNDRGDWGFSTVVRIQSITHHITANDWIVSCDVDQPIVFDDGGTPLPTGGWDRDLWDTGTWDSA